jgi:uncharacterized radical SAM superfamily protein
MICIALCIIGLSGIALAVESGNCRLLSMSESEKLILVSLIPSKTKYLLDASGAKITINGKPAEFIELKQFSIIQVKMDLHKSNRNGVLINGRATEIRILPPQDTKQD